MSEPVSRAVFLSYAREDVVAAQRIADALRAFGIEVWLDRHELRGGDAWDAKIRKEIHACALFLPIVSAQTQARGEGYFRREWRLAAERTRDMAEGVPFVVPIAIDGVAETGAAVPEEFLRVQWSRLVGALPTPQFVEHVKHLLAPPRTPAGAARAPGDEESKLRPPRRAKFSRAMVAVLGAAVLAVAGYLTVGHFGRPSVAAASDKSIAVLPFANWSTDPDNEFFADGIHEDLLTNLQNIRELRVLPRQSVNQYRRSQKTMRQIGAELGVAFLLEGSVRRAGKRVRVTGQLIDARTEGHIWAKTYERDLSDIFAIQSDLAQAIAVELRAALSPQEKALLARRPTEVLAAYDTYLKALDIRRRSGAGPSALRQQEPLLRSAVTLDPKFAIAWAELVFVDSRLYHNAFADHTPARRATAKTDLENAVRLAPHTPETVLASGRFAADVQQDYAAAEIQFAQLAQLHPNTAEVFGSLGVVQRHLGKWADAAASLRRATQLEPDNYTYANDLMVLLRGCRHYGEAIAEQRRISSMRSGSVSRPRDLSMLFFHAHGSTKEMEKFIADLHATSRDPSRLIEECKKWACIRGDLAEALRLEREHPLSVGKSTSLQSEALAALNAAFSFAAADELEGVRSRLGNLPSRHRASLEIEPGNAALWSQLGIMEALLGHCEEALKCAERALESVSRWEGSMQSGIRAMVLAWTGDKQTAIAEFERLFRTAPFSFGWSVHEARHSLWFTPLRGDPRWDAVLNDPKSSAPLF